MAALSVSSATGGAVFTRVGKCAASRVEQLGVMHDRVVIDVVANRSLIRRPRHVSHDAFGISGALHQAIGRGQIRRSQIRWPVLRITIRQLLLDVRERGVRPDALPRQQVDGIGPHPSVRQAACRRGCKASQPVVDAREDLGRNFLPAIFRLDEEVRGVYRRELRRLRRRRPQPEAAAVVGAPAQDREGELQRLRRAALHPAELRACGQDQRRHSAADQLLGARVRIVVEIRGESLAPDERHARHRGFNGSSFAIEIARQRRGLA